MQFYFQMYSFVLEALQIAGLDFQLIYSCDETEKRRWAEDRFIN